MKKSEVRLLDVEILVNDTEIGFNLNCRTNNTILCFPIEEIPLELLQIIGKRCLENVTDILGVNAELQKTLLAREKKDKELD